MFGAKRKKEPAVEEPPVKLQQLLSEEDKRELALAEAARKQASQAATEPEQFTYVKRVTAPAKPKVKKITAVRVKK